MVPVIALRGTARLRAAGHAEYVRDHYLAYKTLDKVTVEFLTKKETEAGWKHAAARYAFTRAELGEPAP